MPGSPDRLPKVLALADVTARLVRRCGALALLPLPLLLSCRQSAFPDVPPGYREFAYVANSATNTVSILDLVYLRADRTLRVGEAPVALATNPVRSEVYVANRGSNSITVIGTAENQVAATIPVQRQPVDVVVASDGRRGYAANSGANSVSVLDLDARREIASIPTGAAPVRLALAPDARTLVVSNQGSGSISIFAVASTYTGTSPAALRLRSSVAGCPGASDLAILPDSSKVFVACSGGHQVMAVSLAASPDSWSARQNVSLLSDHFLTMLDVGLHPGHLTLKPDGGEIFVSNSDSDSISEIATSTNEVGGTYTIASHPGPGLASADNATLWFTNASADTLGIYSIDDGRLAGSVRTGSGPQALAFSADEHLILSANAHSGDVAVIRTTGKSGPALFTMLPAGSSPIAIVTRASTSAK